MNGWGLVLLACAVVGGLGTLICLRMTASRRASEMADLVTHGSIQWGAQVREKIGGRWGISGRLLVTGTTLTIEPDRASSKRGAQVVSWPVDTIRLDFGPVRRDISGVTYRMLTLSGYGANRDFGCFKVVGSSPRGFDS